MAENNSSAPLKTAEGAYPALPAPDTHCHDEDTGRDVWSYSAEQMRAYAAQAVAAQAAPAAEPLPLLVRDIARDIGISSLDACQALKGLGNFSVNSAVTADMARKLRECFPEATEDSSAGDLAEVPADEQQPAFYAVFGSNDMPLPQYSGYSPAVVASNVLAVARQQGHKGTSGEQRMRELGWAVRPVFARPHAEVQAEPVACVYLVNTGEVRNGLELYERHDHPVPLAEYEALYTAPQAQPADALDAAARE